MIVRNIASLLRAHFRLIPQMVPRADLIGYGRSTRRMIVMLPMPGYTYRRLAANEMSGRTGNYDLPQVVASFEPSKLKISIAPFSAGLAL